MRINPTQLQTLPEGSEVYWWNKKGLPGIYSATIRKEGRSTIMQCIDPIGIPRDPFVWSGKLYTDLTECRAACQAYWLNRANTLATLANEV